MNSFGLRFAQCLAGAALAVTLAAPAHASGVIGFALDADQTGANENLADPANFGTGRYVPTGGNVVQVPASGGTYYIDVVSTTDNASVTKIGFQNGYYGAISKMINPNSLLHGGVVANTYTNTSGTGVIGTDLNNNDLWGHSLAGGSDLAQVGSVQDNNFDGLTDLGGVSGESNQNVGPGTALPWWVRPNSGQTPNYAITTSMGKFQSGSVGPSNTLNAKVVVIGYFVVDFPAYVPIGATYVDTLAYDPVLSPSSSSGGPTYFWAEVSGGVTSLRNGSFSTQAGVNSLLAGTGITFQALEAPEPTTFTLIGLGCVGLIASARLRKRLSERRREAVADVAQ